MVKIASMNVAQATLELVLAGIFVTTGNGDRVSSTVKVSFTKLSYGHERHTLYTYSATHILGPRELQQKCNVLNFHKI